MNPIPDINPNTDVDVSDSCNCWSQCCQPREEKEKVLTDKIRRIVMEELSNQKTV